MRQPVERAKTVLIAIALSLLPRRPLGSLSRGRNDDGHDTIDVLVEATPLALIRTLTVGPGVPPDRRSTRGPSVRGLSPPVRTFTSPRKGSHSVLFCYQYLIMDLTCGRNLLLHPQNLWEQQVVFLVHV